MRGLSVIWGLSPHVSGDQSPHDSGEQGTVQLFTAKRADPAEIGLRSSVSQNCAM